MFGVLKGSLSGVLSWDPRTGLERFAEATPRRVLWAILAVVFIGGCGLYYWPVMEVRIPGRFEGIPRTSRDMPYLTDRQKQEAEEIIRASGIVELVNGGQGWDADWRTLRSANSIPGTKGVTVEVFCERPVDGSGPWSLVKCRGTRKISHNQKWSHVSRLVTWVDLEAKSVVGYGVTSEPEDDPAAKMGSPNLLGIARLYDVQTGKRLTTAPVALVPPEPLACPPGTHYWD